MIFVKKNKVEELFDLETYDGVNEVEGCGCTVNKSEGCGCTINKECPNNVEGCGKSASLASALSMGMIFS